MKYLIIAFLLLMGLTPCLAQTDKQETIDLEYRGCLAKDSNSANIDQCAFTAYAKWDKEMDKAYKKLLNALNKAEDKAAVKQSQAAWIAYKNAEFKSYDCMFNRPGNQWCLLRQNSRIGMVRARTVLLNNYLEVMRQNPQTAIGKLLKKSAGVKNGKKGK